MSLNISSTMAFRPEAIDQTKMCIDNFIKAQLRQSNSEVSVLWIREEFIRQKDFNRKTGLSFSDADISMIDCPSLNLPDSTTIGLKVTIPFS